MIATKSLISSIHDVPITWVFEYYLNLTEKLEGQDVMILSPFNSKDKVPSCSIYWHHKLDRYQFKDYSSGEGGSCQDLIRKLFCLNPGAAMYRIIEDYNQFIINNKGSYTLNEFKNHSNYKLTSFNKRQWTTLDKNYWTQYKLGSKILEQYHVYPLSDYTLSKEEAGDIKTLTINGHNIYGFFKEDGSVYKIYQPKIRDKKFLKIKDYIQGTEQLTYTKPILVICSSLKDLMCLVNYKWNIEVVAPHSENTLIPEHIIQAYKHKYQNIFTLFDNDEAGITAMKKYKEKYGLNYIHLELEKDLSDSISKLGKNVVEPILKELIDSKINLI